jgi:signal peptidase II
MDRKAHQMTQSNQRMLWTWLVLATVLVLLDQLTKAMITTALAPEESIAVTRFFNLVYTMNPGAAFSFLASAPGWQRWFFSAIALGASIVLVVLIARHPRSPQATAYTLILGGAIGNLCDRIRHGAVVDWLDFHAHGMHWPAFNLADVWIVIGAGLMLWISSRATHPVAETEKEQ